MELYNASDAPVSLDGLVPAVPLGHGRGGANAVAALSGSIPAKGYYLVKGATQQRHVHGADLPAADARPPA